MIESFEVKYNQAVVIKATGDREMLLGWYLS